MTLTKSALVAIAMAFACSTSSAFALDAPAGKPAVAKEVQVPKAAKVKKVKAPKVKKTDAEKAAQKVKSKECSAQADAQKLHGKPRKAFRKSCMKKAA